jgi:hypothetical protein
MEMQRLVMSRCREEVMDDFSRPIRIKMFKFRYSSRVKPSEGRGILMTHQLTGILLGGLERNLESRTLIN